MEKAKFINATYIESSTRTHQGNMNSIQRFLNDGYHIHQHRNGYFVLVKPARIVAMFQDSTGRIFNTDIKQDIVNFYKRKQISKSLFEQFYNDATNGNVFFYLDNNVVKFSKS